MAGRKNGARKAGVITASVTFEPDLLVEVDEAAGRYYRGNRSVFIHEAARLLLAHLRDLHGPAPTELRVIARRNRRA